mmetsp:Transcript_20653/g.35963  ORF Transcript_20653/g.35963 Transcript_20653/m.35963 type:complete len:573 (-) Transcript_20653:279-1997(-)
MRTIAGVIRTVLLLAVALCVVSHTLASSNASGLIEGGDLHVSGNSTTLVLAPQDAVAEPSTVAPVPMQKNSPLKKNVMWNMVRMFALPVLIFMCFVALAIVCDDYLAPSLETFVDKVGMPHDVASATFLAFGSSAPEISINCVATIHGKVSLSLSAVLGSGIIAYTVIPAACVLVSKGQVLRLEAVPLIRDMVFYAASLSVFVVFTFEGSFTKERNISMLLLFVGYLVVMVVLGKIYHGKDSLSNKVTGATVEEQLPLTGETSEIDSQWESKEPFDRTRLLVRWKTDSDIPRHHIDEGYGTRNPFDDELSEAEARQELEEVENKLDQALRWISTPLRLLFHVTIPPLCWSPPDDDDDDDEADIGPSASVISANDEVKQKLSRVYPLTMLMSLVYVALFSELVLIFTTDFAELVGLSHTIAGLTIVALGAQVPDLFASMSVAKQGEGPSSIANAVGSQIINILVGIGGPFLVYNWQTGSAVDVMSSGASDGAGLAMTGVMMLFLVVVFSMLCFRHMSCGKGDHHQHNHSSHNHSHHHHHHTKPALTSLDAVILAVLYVVMIVVLVCSETIVRV